MGFLLDFLKQNVIIEMGDMPAIKLSLWWSTEKTLEIVHESVNDYYSLCDEYKEYRGRGIGNGSRRHYSG